MNTSSLQFRLLMVIVSVGIMVALVAGMFVWQMSGKLSLREQDAMNQTLRDTLQNRLDSKLDVGLTNAAALAVRPDIVTALMSGDPAFAKTTLAGVSENIKKETNYNKPMPCMICHWFGLEEGLNPTGFFYKMKNTKGQTKF